MMLAFTILQYFTILSLIPAFIPIRTIGETTSIANAQTEIIDEGPLTDNNDNDDITVSFGIKSFTVEINKPTIKPLNTTTVQQNDDNQDESTRNIDIVDDSMKFNQFQSNHLSASTTDNIGVVTDVPTDAAAAASSSIIEQQFQHITTELPALPQSTEFNDDETTISPIILNNESSSSTQSSHQNLNKGKIIKDTLITQRVEEVNKHEGDGIFEHQQQQQQQPDDNTEDERPTSISSSILPTSSLISVAVSSSSSSSQTSATLNSITTGVTISPTLEYMTTIGVNGDGEVNNAGDIIPAAAITVTSSGSAIFKTEEPMINDIHIEKKLENGLYRIKLAEIITNEFNGGERNTGGGDGSPAVDSGGNMDTINLMDPRRNDIHQQQQQQQQQHQAQPSQSSVGKINIIDLYPSKLEDFGPIIKESNEKILKVRDEYLKSYDKNALPNSLNGLFEDDDGNIPTSKIEIELIDDNSNNNNNNNNNYNNNDGRQENSGKSSSSSSDIIDKITDFTGKLQQQDGVITEIEKKFRLNEFKQQSTPKTLSPSPSSSSLSVNRKIDFIDRRVKKSFDYQPNNQFSRFGRIDFANTKFNTDSTKRETNPESGRNDRPEFSTTKFYNSKELYNEMLHKKLTADILGAGDGRIATLLEPLTTVKLPPSSLSSSSSHLNISVNSGDDNNSTTIINRRNINGGSTRNETTFMNSAQNEKRNDGKSSITSTILSDSKPSPSTPSSSSFYYESVISRSTTPHTTPKPLKKTKAFPRTTKTTITTTPTKSIETLTGFDTQSPLMMKIKTLKQTIPRRSHYTGSQSYRTTTTGSISIPLTPAVNTISTTAHITRNEVGATKKSTAPKERFRERQGIRISENANTSSSASSSLSEPGISVMEQMMPSSSLSSPSSSSSLLSSDPSSTMSPNIISKITEYVPIVATENPRPVASAPHASVGTDTVGNPSLYSSTSTISRTRKPFSRPRVLTRLQEKINSLECDIQNLPQDSHLWRGNETHELLLPITVPENCKAPPDCLPMIVSWEGQAEIQSGDVLLVEINDSMMILPPEVNQDNRNNTHKAATRVYQVTRPGHEHCDVTEGVLLDITPLVVDGKKLVTLYDKDLTEGINLLIVVSELWGTQCVRLKVTVKSDNCGENADCSGKGVCFSNVSMEGYECQCCSGFAGPHCEEIDACSPSPCTNNGICVDLSQGHEGNAYQCLCPYGYTGKNCQYESDPCNPAECMNGGSCVGNSTHFRCDCAPGYTGPLCQHNLNECESSPCVHGICVDQEDGFRCFCQPGFAGELCNFEYNECESNPCLNGGECIDQIGSFECKCTKGYTGNQCHIKVDFCANGPCPEGHRCIDHGDDFTCECPGGRNGPDCNQVPRTLCNINPCANGGTCWTSEDSFYCACRPGYTGKMCEDEFVVETVVSSSEFMVDDTGTGNAFSEKSFGSAVAKSPIELHNAYIAAGTLAAAIFIVAVVVTICHCKVHQTYRRFSTRHHQLIPIFGFGKRIKSPKSHRHWLSGKGGGGGGGGTGVVSTAGGVGSTGNKLNKVHLQGTGVNQCQNHHIGGGSTTFHHQQVHQVHDRPFQRHLAMNLENDMYYTVDFSDSQNSPLIQ